MRLIPRKQFASSLLITGLLFLAACSSGGTTPPTDSVQIAGTYNGAFVIGNSTPFVSVKTTFKVDAAGNVSGTTTSVNDRFPNDKGTIQGTIQGGSASSLNYNLQFESPAMGKYAMTGKGVFSSLTNELGANMSAKNSAGTYIGDAPMTARRE